MADWVHCNLCFRQPGDGRKYFLTSCGHMYCEECANTGTTPKCKLCSSQCTSIQLSSKMKADVEIFFTDPAEIVKRHQKQLKQVMDFQRNHRQRLTAFNREKLARQTSIVHKAQQSISNVKTLERDITSLREENDYLKKLISSMGGCHGNRPFNGMSRGHSGASSQSHRNLASPSQSSRNANSPYQYNRTHSVKSAERIGMSSIHASHVVKGPARVSVRTPPVDGRIGVIPGTPSPRTTSHGSVRCGSEVRSEGGTLSGQTPSPMSCSPVSHYRPRASGTTPGVPIDPQQQQQPTSNTATPPASRSAAMMVFSTPKRPYSQQKE